MPDRSTSQHSHPKGWHFSPTVTLGHIMTTLSMFGAGATLLFGMQTEIATLKIQSDQHKELIAAQKELIESQKKEYKEDVKEIKTNIKDINTKIDRQNEKVTDKLDSMMKLLIEK